MIKLETLEFLQSLVNQVNIHAGSEDFEKTAEQIISAKKELKAEIDDSHDKRGSTAS